jgi:hypothetical protein
VTSARAPLSLAILPGRADDMRAEIMVRVTVNACDGGGRPHLAGTCVGPRRGRDMTLPTTVKLVDVGGDHGRSDVGQAWGRAVFTEPAYWTPELPNLYRLEASVHDGDRPVAVCDRMIGLRRLGVRGRSLWLEGRRWVPRGVRILPTGFEPKLLRSLAAAAVMDDPCDAICEAADREGVAVIARLAGADARMLTFDRAAERISAWAVHPSVVLAMVPGTAAGEEAKAIVAAVKPTKGTMLVGLEVDGTQAPDAVPPELFSLVDCIMLDLPGDRLPHEGWRSGGPWEVGKPLLAQRTVTDGSTAEHRLECDRLQGALAAWGIAGGAAQLPWDWAGYCVVSRAG